MILKVKFIRASLEWYSLGTRCCEQHYGKANKTNKHPWACVSKIQVINVKNCNILWWLFIYLSKHSSKTRYPHSDYSEPLRKTKVFADYCGLVKLNCHSSLYSKALNRFYSFSCRLQLSLRNCNKHLHVRQFLLSLSSWIKTHNFLGSALKYLFQQRTLIPYLYGSDSHILRELHRKQRAIRSANEFLPASPPG